MECRVMTGGRIAASTLMSLRREFDTDWLPDPWRLADFERDLAAVRPVSHLHKPERLTVPFVGGRTRVVPLLDPWCRLAFQQLAGDAASEAESRLSEGVLAYRLQPDRTVEHYRLALARRQRVEQSLAKLHSLVVTVDVRRFFPSIRRELLEQQLGEGPATARLRELLTQFDAWFGYPLPEGYAASRMLANIALKSVDERVGAPFTRWVDDYRVFCDSAAQADLIVRRLDSALADIGLKRRQDKTRVMPSSEVASDDASSLGPHEHTRLHASLQGRDFDRMTDVAAERGLRLVLRVAAAERNGDVLATLAAERPEAIPPSALPRLAWLMSTVAWSNATTALMSGLLDLHDDLEEWRVGRLAAALWYAPTTAVEQFTPALRKSIDSFACPRPIVARVLARHAADLLEDCEHASDSESWRRAWRLSSADRCSGRSRPTIHGESPPIESFL